MNSILIEKIRKDLRKRAQSDMTVTTNQLNQSLPQQTINPGKGWGAVDQTTNYWSAKPFDTINGKANLTNTTPGILTRLKNWFTGQEGPAYKGPAYVSPHLPLQGHVLAQPTRQTGW